MLLPERVRAFVQDNHKMQAAAGNCCSNKPFDFKGEITSQSPEWICAHIIASNQTSVDFRMLPIRAGSGSIIGCRQADGIAQPRQI
jgi:hypothetical protein